MADDVVYINEEDGLKRMMNNGGLFSKLLIKFKNDTNMEAVEAAFGKEDLENAKTSAHTLKGLAANLSLMELYKQVLELENQLKAGTFNSDQLALVKDVYSQTLIETDKVIEKYA